MPSDNTLARNIKLPVRGSLRWVYVSSSIIAILLVVASLAGLQDHATIYPSFELAQTFLPNDMVSLLVGLPILLGSMWFAGGVLAGLGSLFLLRVMVVVLKAKSNPSSLPETALAVNVADFLTTPAWVIGGILLWKRKELGYVTGLGLLFQGSMLFIALIIFLLLQPILTGAPFAFTDILVIFVMGLVCFIPFGMYILGVNNA